MPDILHGPMTFYRHCIYIYMYIYIYIYIYIYKERGGCWREEVGEVGVYLFAEIFFLAIYCTMKLNT